MFIALFVLALAIGVEPVLAAMIDGTSPGGKDIFNAILTSICSIGSGYVYFIGVRRSSREPTTPDYRRMALRTNLDTSSYLINQINAEFGVAGRRRRNIKAGRAAPDVASELYGRLR